MSNRQLLLAIILLIAVPCLAFVAYWQGTHLLACNVAGDNPYGTATEYHPLSGTCTARIFGTDVRVF